MTCFYQIHTTITIMKCLVGLLLLGLIGLSMALPEMLCPRPEWVKRRSNNHCYWFEEGDHLPQYKADERCRRYNGKLTTIDDQAENDWILKVDKRLCPQIRLS